MYSSWLNASGAAPRPSATPAAKSGCDGRTTASTEFLESTVLRDLEDVFDDDAEVSRASLEL